MSLCGSQLFSVVKISELLSVIEHYKGDICICFCVHDYVKLDCDASLEGIAVFCWFEEASSHIEVYLAMHWGQPIAFVYKQQDTELLSLTVPQRTTGCQQLYHQESECFFRWALKKATAQDDSLIRTLWDPEAEDA